jgi:hypothetical protein
MNPDQSERLVSAVELIAQLLLEQHKSKNGENNAN